MTNRQTNRRDDKGRLIGIVVCGLGVLAAGSLPAQSEDGAAPATPVAAEDVADAAQMEMGEIVVSARKRQESILKVPVVMTAISQDTLENLQVTEMTDLPKLAPGLSVGHSMLAVGSIMAIRGVGTTTQDVGVDQSISLNIDGMSLSNGLAFSSGMFDVGQVEVLKGPQALFFGKGSPGGVISLRSADPTDEVEVSVRQGYEFEGDENRGELIVSGPLTETLKGRLAGMYATGDGYFVNNSVAPDPAVYGTDFGAQTPGDREEPGPKNRMLRGTLLWEPTDRFSARLKLNLVSDEAYGNPETAQLSSCPDGAESAPIGVPYIGGDNCDMDEILNNIYLNPAAYPGDASLQLRPLGNDGVPYVETYQQYGTLELNYDLTPELTLTSLTGAYHIDSDALANTFHTTSAPPPLSVETFFSRREITEELRLTSDFSGPLNFMLGGFYQDARAVNEVIYRANTQLFPAVAWPLVNRHSTSIMDIETNALFGQLRYNIRPDIELAGGLRWSDEMRRLSSSNGHAYQVPVPPFVIPAGPYEPGDPKVHSANVAWETTLTWTPTEDLTLFAAYKVGYKSGSFSLLPAAPGEDLSFDDEKVDGYEFGLKSRLFDRQVLFNIAAYNYDFDGLQVGAIEPAPNGIPVIHTLNAGSAETYGIEMDIAYRPIQIEGLSLNASANWNHGRYETLDNVPCYTGQTIAQGCNQDFSSSTGLFYAQDLSGTRMVQAPDWQANFGFDYTFQVGSNLEMVIANNNQYSSKVPTFLAVGRPNEDHYQRRFIKSDLSIALKDIDERWEVALIGKNIGDKITSTFCSAADFATAQTFGASTTGGPAPGLSGWAEVGCYTERGRSVWLRLTWRPQI